MSLKSQLEQDINEKVLEKTASRAWKYYWNTLSPASRKAVQRAGVYNPAKEIAGTNLGTSNLAKAHGIDVFNSLTPAQITSKLKTKDSIPSTGFGRALIDKGVVTEEQAIDGALATVNGGALPFSALIGGKPAVFMPKSNEYVKTLIGMAGDPISTSSRNMNWMDAIVRRHEVRESISNARAKSGLIRTSDGTDLSSDAYRVGSHFSPRVLAEESALSNLAFPKGKSPFNKIRNFSPDQTRIPLFPGFSFSEAGSVEKYYGTPYADIPVTGLSKRVLAKGDKAVLDEHIRNYPKLLDNILAQIKAANNQ